MFTNNYLDQRVTARKLILAEAGKRSSDLTSLMSLKTTQDEAAFLAPVPTAQIIVEVRTRDSLGAARVAV